MHVRSWRKSRRIRTALTVTALGSAFLIAPTLQALWRSAQKHAVSRDQIEESRRSITQLSSGIRARARAGFEPMPASISGKWLSACMNRVFDERTLLVNEYPTVLEEGFATGCTHVSLEPTAYRTKRHLGARRRGLPPERQREVALVHPHERLRGLARVDLHSDAGLRQVVLDDLGLTGVRVDRERQEAQLEPLAVRKNDVHLSTSWSVSITPWTRAPASGTNHA